MPTLQTGTNYTVRIVRQAALGTAAVVGTTPCWQLRSNTSPGLEKKSAPIRSNERTANAVVAMPRLGPTTVDGSYNFDLTIGGATDMILEAIMRGTWVAASALTTSTGAGACVDLTANAVNQITRTGSGSFITDGWKEGDVARLTTYSTAADNNIDLRVVTVTALVLTFAGSPLTIGAADTSAILTRQKKLITPATPTRYIHTLEQYEVDGDLSQLFIDCRCVGVKLSMKPGQMATYTAMFVGTDRQLLVTGTSPWFTTPVLTTGVGLVTDDSAIWLNGAIAAYITGYDLDFSIANKLENVIGTRVSPDVFDNDMTVSGTVTALRSGFVNPILYDAETEFNIGLLCKEPGTAPVGMLSTWIPRAKIMGLSAPLGNDGPMIETLPIAVATATVNGTATSDATVAVFSSSAP